MTELVVMLWLLIVVLASLRGAADLLGPPRAPRLKPWVWTETRVEVTGVEAEGDIVVVVNSGGARVTIDGVDRSPPAA